MKMSDERLLSIDALRGFDMMMIMGVDRIAAALSALLGWEWLARQFSHPEWFGLSFYDTIFPLFLFLAGLSFPFSYARQVEKGTSSRTIHLRILRRLVILFVFGLLVNRVQDFDFETMRFGSVLCKIGMGWALAALCYVHFGRKTRIGVCAALIVVYGILQFVVAPDAPPGTDPMSLRGCFVGWLDRLWMPGRLYQSNLMEPSGFNVNLFSTATALLGVFAGEIVRDAGVSGERKTVRLLAVAAGLLAAGLALLPVMPVCKRLWNPSFTLLVGAYSYAIFALFYYLVDVRRWRKWTFFLVVIGMNSITIYMLQRLVNFDHTARYLLNGVLKLMPEGVALLVLAISVFALKWAVLRFLYEKKTFLKV